MHYSKNRQAGPALSIITLVALAACGGGGGGGGGGLDGALNGPNSTWLIPRGQVIDAGPGVDGIPSIDSPVFEAAATITTVEPDDEVIVLRRNGAIKVYPLDIMTWHEIVNDVDANGPFTLSFCPLTGTAMGWEGNMAHANPTFGTTGLLYNANLLMYDRETDTVWSQMLQIGVNGPRIREQASQFPVVETRFSTVQQMYPNAMVLTRETGVNRDYDDNPYGDYSTSGNLLFTPNNLDNRLFPKARVQGIYSDTTSRVYRVAAFGSETRTINDQFENQSIVVVGNTDEDYSIIFDRRLPDGTVLNFSPLQDQLPAIMTDDEGNVWDIFGTAISGPRAGQQLNFPSSYKAMWFAWVGFFRNAEIFE